jgi:DNA-binding response OmpR family regulator
VAVAVAPPFTDRLADLGEVLGPGFTVAWGVPQATGLAVIRAASPATVAFWRARHRACGLLVLDPLGEYSSAACLDAGADAYVAGPITTAEVAAILRSLARRLVRLPQPA